MQEDFHYYGTFYAAREAGFEKKQAETIAFSANYVDYHNYDRTKKKRLVFQDRTRIFEPTITSGYNNLLEPTVKKGTHRRVWTPFHFLPGNYELRGKPTNYNVLRDMPAYRGGHRHRDKRKCLLTRPYSWLAIDMINDTVNKRSLQNWNAHILNLIGIRMHVFADTWAHQDFSGKISLGLNNYKHFRDRFDIFEPVPGSIREKEIQFTFGEGSGIKHSPRLVGGAPYLGHGRMGCFPDLPWVVYKYCPSWGNSFIERNNPDEFFQAFVNMVEALKCIKKGREYKPIQPWHLINKRDRHIKYLKWQVHKDKYRKINEELHSDPRRDKGSWSNISDTLILRCEKWKALIRNKHGGGEVPDPFDHDLFLKNSQIVGMRSHKVGQARAKKVYYRSGTGFQYSQYCRFSVAAFEQFKFVRDRLHNIVDLETRQRLNWRIEDEELYETMQNEVANVADEEYMYNDINNTLKSIIDNTGVREKRTVVQGTKDRIEEIQADRRRRDRNGIIQQYYDEIQRLANNNMLMLRSRGRANQRSRAVRMVEELKTRLPVLKSEVERFEVRLQHL